MRSDRATDLLRAFRVWSHGPDYRHGSLSEICSAIGASDREQPQVRELLDQLEEKGETISLTARGWFVPHREGWLVGTLTLARKGFGFVRPLVDDPLGDAFIPARRLRDGHHGDRVLAAIHKPRRGAPARASEGRSGKILEVIERSPRVIPGIYRESGGGAGVVEPLLHESVREVWIDPGFRAGVEDGDRVLARLRQGATIEGMPPGQVLCALAPEGTWKADLQLVCAEHQLRQEFPAEVEQAAASFSEQISEREIKLRSDHREIPFITIDPEDAKDFDDAVTVVESPSGGFRLGVAIADVSHFVQQGDVIDGEALLRGTSVYIPGKTIPMLPERLSNDLCSLRPGVDRLAKVVWIDLDTTGQLQDYFVERAVIRSARRFSYQQVQEVLDQQDQNSSDSANALDQLIFKLNEVRSLLHDRRLEEGSLELEIDEMKLVLDDEGEVIDVRPRSRLTAHNLVEECMLVANEAVASIATARNIAILRRVHSPPEPESLEKFSRLCRVLAPEATVKDVADLSGVIGVVRQTPVAPVIFFALLQTLTRAQYSPDRQIHFALQKQEYCHFTSPIRRYPDLQVHQALDRHLFDGVDPVIDPASVSLLEVGETCSTRERAAESAERDMTRSRAISWLRHRVGERFTGLVTSVRDQGFHVRLDEALIEGFVHVSLLKDDIYVFSDTQFALRGVNAGNMIRLGDPVEVELESVDLLQRDINLRYLHTRSGGSRGKGAGGVSGKKIWQRRPQQQRSSKKNPSSRSKARAGKARKPGRAGARRKSAGRSQRRKRG